MATKKKPTKLDSEELDAVTAIFKAERDNKDTLASMTIALHNLNKQIKDKISSIDGNRLALTKLQEAFQKKYGDVNIDVQTGKFVKEGVKE